MSWVQILTTGSVKGRHDYLENDMVSTKKRPGIAKNKPYQVGLVF